MLYALTELSNAIHFKNVNLLKKATLYALEKLEFAKIQPYKIQKREISDKTIALRFKKVNFC